MVFLDRSETAAENDRDGAGVTRPRSTARTVGLPTEILPTGTRPGPDTVTPSPEHSFPAAELAHPASGIRHSAGDSGRGSDVSWTRRFGSGSRAMTVRPARRDHKRSLAGTSDP